MGCVCGKRLRQRKGEWRVTKMRAKKMGRASCSFYEVCVCQRHLPDSPTQARCSQNKKGNQTPWSDHTRSQTSVARKTELGEYLLFNYFWMFASFLLIISYKCGWFLFYFMTGSDLPLLEQLCIYQSPMVICWQSLFLDHYYKFFLQMVCSVCV